MNASNCGFDLAFEAEAVAEDEASGAAAAPPPFFPFLPLSWGVSTPCFTASGTFLGA